jgi:flagellar biosynthetic protein FlhB
MSEDADPESKTEDPSGKRLADAAEKGNVAKSMEISYWFTFLAASIALWMLSGTLSSRVVSATTMFFAQPHLIPIDPSHLARIAVDLALDLGIVLSPVLGLFVLASLAASVVQNPIQVSLERIKPSFEKLSPMAGLKRMFGLQNAVELVKNLVKIAVIGGILLTLLIPELDELETLIDLDLSVILPLCLSIVSKLVGALLGTMFIVAVADYLYQRHSFMKQLRMTKQEVKDEYKEIEGDPMIKARLRQLRMQRVRQRMMQAVPQASVVVTNPTHFAVALKYEQGQQEAPIVVAKGADNIARRIREIATEHKVPIVENPPLARALYKVEIDNEIPVEHFRAVAEVISYIMKLKDGIATKYEPKVQTIEATE